MLKSSTKFHVQGLLFVFVLAGTGMTSSDRAEAQARIIDACSFITSWQPARRKCYEIWLRFCPLVTDADVRADCVAALQAAKAGQPLPAEVAKREPAQPTEEKIKPADGREASAASHDSATGETTTSVRNPDGSHTVTRTDADGNILERHVEPKTRPTMASATEPKTGITTTSLRNDDGSRTVTRTDASGKVLSTQVMPKNPASEISSKDVAGNTTRSVRNADGSRTVTITDAAGNLISKEVRPATKARKAKAEDKDKAAPQPGAKPRAKAPAGAITLPDFCSGIDNPIARKNCYGFGKMVRQLCNLLPPSREKIECKKITARIPERLGPFDG